MLAPLAFVVGGLAMLFTGLKLLFSNWQLTLVQVLPAMWIWLAMYDLRAHALHGESFSVCCTARSSSRLCWSSRRSPLPASSYNTAFGFAIVQSGRPQIRPAFGQARSHLAVILGSGAALGLLLGLSTVVVTRWGRPYVISLSVVVGAMMICYVAIPSRLIGVKPTSSRRDKLTASAVGGALGAVVCTPPYVLARVGLLMLGSHALFIPGIVVLTVGITLQAGATGAVKAIKMSAKLVAADQRTPLEPVRVPAA